MNMTEQSITRNNVHVKSKWKEKKIRIVSLSLSIRTFFTLFCLVNRPPPPCTLLLSHPDILISFTILSTG